MILHIPHSSALIPDNFRDQIILTDEELLNELLLMTDSYTEILFDFPSANSIIFPISRLLVDVERFSDNTKEPMNNVGMGMIYERTSHGGELKREIHANEREILAQYHQAHHSHLSTMVSNELESKGNVLIIDCHSFPGIPLPCDEDQSTSRPGICIGTDSFHTPDSLVEAVERIVSSLEYTYKINQPYIGSIVPIDFYHKNSQVMSIMIEVNRSLYMNESTGMKTVAFENTKYNIQAILNSIKTHQLRGKF